MDLRFRLLNVFAIEGDPFSGNPLCVFEDASALSDRQMQSWARQFNLSETTFVTGVAPSEVSADVRIFTASYEMPFAGHPTLGTAHVVAGALSGASGQVDELTLSMPAGRIPVRRTRNGWQLRANPAKVRPLEVSLENVAQTLGLPVEAVAEDGSSWVDAGVEQLIVQLSEGEAVRASLPSPGLMAQHLTAPGRPPHVYVWAWTGESSLEARLFALSGTALDEDPATGSACSNLGGWLVSQGHRGVEIAVSQGAQVRRPSRLELTIGADGEVLVGGHVQEVGEGVVRMEA